MRENKPEVENKIAIMLSDKELRFYILGEWDFISSVKDKLHTYGCTWNELGKFWYKQFPPILKIQKVLIKNFSEFFDLNFSGYYDKDDFNKIFEELSQENIDKKYLTNLPMKIKDNLMGHQLEALRKYDIQRYKILLAWEMGSGKTFAALAIMKSQNKKGIIVVPKSLVNQWQEEILKWKITTEERIFIFSEKKEDNIRVLYSHLNSDRVDFFILNYEKIRCFNNLDKVLDAYMAKLKVPKKKKNEMILRLNAFILKYYSKSFIRGSVTGDKNIDFVKSILEYEFKDYELQLICWFLMLKQDDYIYCYDEMYKIKNYKSQLFIANNYLVNKCREWFGTIGLTGTPMENNLYEFYTILNFIKEYTITYKQMTKHFVYKTNWGDIRYRNLGYFNELANKIMYRVTKKDIKKDLPELVQEYRFVNHSGKAISVMNTLKSNAESMFEIYASLRTLDSFFESHEDLKIYPKIGDIKIEFKNKLDELLNILEEIGDNKILIFTAYSKTMNWLVGQLRELKYKVKGIDAGVKNKDDIRDEFLHGDLQIVIATDTWAYGVDLPDIDYLVNWDLLPNPAKMQQRICRIYRINSKEHKTVVNLIGNIVEKDIYDIIKNKLKNFELAVEGTEEKKVMVSLASKYGLALGKEKSK